MVFEHEGAILQRKLVQTCLEAGVVQFFALLRRSLRRGKNCWQSIFPKRFAENVDGDGTKIVDGIADILFLHRLDFAGYPVDRPVGEFFWRAGAPTHEYFSQPL